MFDDGFAFLCNWHIYFSTHDVTMCSFDGAELRMLVSVHIQSLPTKLINKENLGLYWNDGLILLRKLKK